MQCCNCDATRETALKADGTPKLPRGWKDHCGVWCAKCWAAEWVTRAATIAVAGPIDGTWEDLRLALRDAGRGCARVANHATRLLYQADVVRTPDLERMPKAPSVYLYPEARRIAPELEPTTVTALLRRVEAEYRSDRLQVIWMQKRALRTYRSPQPIPVHRQSWHPLALSDGRPAISVRVGGSRWTLRLRGGHEWRRQLGMHRALLAEEARQGELQLIERAGSRGDHRGRGRKKPMLLAKMVVTVRRESRPSDRTLTVATGGDRLWTWWVDESHEERYAAARALRWIAAHRRRLRRAADDHRHERRLPRARFEDLLQDDQAWIGRHRRRMRSWVQEAVAHLIGYATRRRCGRIVYDDTDTSYGELPWHALWVRLEQRAHADGITCERRSAPEGPGTARDDTTPVGQ